MHRRKGVLDVWKDLEGLGDRGQLGHGEAEKVRCPGRRGGVRRGRGAVGEAAGAARR